MNEDIELMVKIYGTYEVDWMGCEFDDPECLTRHHIVKREDGGENGISNYALLTYRSHMLLHYMETNFHDDYVRLNQLFLALNRSLKPPTAEYYEEVKKIIKRVKKTIKNNGRSRRHK